MKKAIQSMPVWWLLVSALFCTGMAGLCISVRNADLFFSGAVADGKVFGGTDSFVAANRNSDKKISTSSVDYSVEGTTFSRDLHWRKYPNATEFPVYYDRDNPPRSIVGDPYDILPELGSILLVAMGFWICLVLRLVYGPGIALNDGQRNGRV